MKSIALKRTFLSLFLFLFSIVLVAQTSQDQIMNSYKEFIKSPREVAYVHLNKSILIKNEMLGFNAYVFDKFTKKPSTVTTNLYCTITDENNKVVKSKLVKVTNGISPNVFKIDSVFNSGKYTFRAYTNWMLNFDEKNYYEHSLTIIDPDKQKEIIQKKVDRVFTTQVLPEGGHIVAGVHNNLGIIVKDKNGFGFANASGVIVDSNNQPIKEFTLNQFGIAKVNLNPIDKEKYRIIISGNDQKIVTPIEDVSDIGFNMSLLNYPKKIRLLFSTNKQSSPLLQKKSYVLVIHNGSEIKSMKFQFNDKHRIIKTLNHQDLFSGVNIFTVFDQDQNIPILERLYFNWDGISMAKIDNMKVKGMRDSLSISLKMSKNIDLSKIQNLSVSVLPKNTKSHQFNSTILSQLHLNPYIKGFVENPHYYFTNISGKVKSDLDNLLITQGWSSYDWSTIFQKQSINHRFENGIDVLARINNEKHKNFMVYPVKDEKPNIVQVGASDSQFTHTNLFPYEKENYTASRLLKNGQTRKAAMYLNFFPSKIPDFTFTSSSTPLKDEIFSISSFNTTPLVPTWNIDDVEQLNEVVVKSEYRRSERIENIKNKSFGRVHVFDSNDRRYNHSLDQYLSGRGFKITREDRSFFNFVIEDRNPISPTPGAQIPLFMVDGVIIEDFNFVRRFVQMNIVDYIDINRGGMGMGVRGGRTWIKIETDPTLSFQDANNAKLKRVSKYPFSLTFSKAKKYYTPIYSSYNSDFFRNFGVISWIPNVKFDKNNTATFKIPRKYKDAMMLRIEGIVNGKELISETKFVK